MRYSQIRSLDVSNGYDVGVALFTQGCPYHCKGCFQPETWDFEGGKEFTDNEIEIIVELVKRSYIKRLSLLGGEPLIPQNYFMLSKLIQKVKTARPDLQIVCYTGRFIEDIMLEIEQDFSNETGVYYLKYIYDNIDMMIDGPFEEHNKDLGLKLRGSSNQRIWVRQRISEKEPGDMLLER